MISKSVHRRGKVACLPCRDRKTRCDATDSRPCTNCKWFKRECIIPKHKTIWKSLQVTPNGTEIKHQTIRTEVTQKPLGPNTRRDSAKRVQTATSSQISMLDSHDTNVYGGGIDQNSSNDHPLFPGIRMQSPRLPPYISPLPLGLSSADRNSLRIKGALDVPEVELRDALLKSFALFVHPFLPVIDLAEIYSRINSNGQAGMVSLMLLQVVMFAASGNVDIHLLKKFGYDSGKEARLDFFNRTFELYSLDCEPDNIALLQTVVLMTLWSNGSDFITQPRSFMAAAMVLAKRIHEDPLKRVSQRLWRRIMWTCYTRDRILAFSSGKPTLFRSEEFGLVPLHIEDFDTQYWPKDVHWELRHIGDPGWNSFSVHTLAKLCIHLTELCQHIPCNLNWCNDVEEDNDYVGKNAEMQFLSGTPDPNPAEALRCVKELERWYSALPRDLQWPKGPLLRDINSRFNDSIIVHRAILSGIYYAATINLCRSALTYGGVAPPLKLDLQSYIDQSSSQITIIFHELDSNGVVKLLPDTAVTILSSAIALHPSRMRREFEQKEVGSANPNVTKPRIHANILWKLKDIYVSADTQFSALAAEAQSHGQLTEVNVIAETSDAKDRSVNQALQQRAFHSYCNTTAPGFLKLGLFYHLSI